MVCTTISLIRLGQWQCINMIVIVVANWLCSEAAYPFANFAREEANQRGRLHFSVILQPNIAESAVPFPPPTSPLATSSSTLAPFPPTPVSLPVTSRSHCIVEEVHCHCSGILALHPDPSSQAKQLRLAGAPFLQDPKQNATPRLACSLP